MSESYHEEQCLVPISRRAAAARYDAGGPHEIGLALRLIRMRFQASLFRASAGVGIGVCIGPRVTVGQGLQEGDDLVLFLIGQPEVTKFLTQVLTDLWRRPAGHLFAGVALFASRQGVACIVEVNNLLETLQ